MYVLLIHHFQLFRYHLNQLLQVLHPGHSMHNIQQPRPDLS